MTEKVTKTSPLLILLAWAIVGIPWLWGFSQTLQKAAALFQ
jgi:hypothetical protein